MTDHRGEAERLIAAVQEIHTIEHIGVSSDAPMLATAHAVLALLDRIDEEISDSERIAELEEIEREKSLQMQQDRNRIENQRQIISRVMQLADQLADQPEHRDMAARIRQAVGLPTEIPADA